jgi:hypothetical protein
MARRNSATRAVATTTKPELRRITNLSRSFDVTKAAGSAATQR